MASDLRRKTEDAYRIFADDEKQAASAHSLLRTAVTDACAWSLCYRPGVDCDGDEMLVDIDITTAEELSVAHEGLAFFADYLHAASLAEQGLTNNSFTAQPAPNVALHLEVAAAFAASAGNTDAESSLLVELASYRIHHREPAKAARLYSRVLYRVCNHPTADTRNHVVKELQYCLTYDVVFSLLQQGFYGVSEGCIYTAFQIHPLLPAAVLTTHLPARIRSLLELCRVVRSSHSVSDVLACVMMLSSAEVQTPEHSNIAPLLGLVQAMTQSYLCRRVWGQLRSVKSTSVKDDDPALLSAVAMACNEFVSVVTQGSVNDIRICLNDGVPAQLHSSGKYVRHAFVTVMDFATSFDALDVWKAVVEEEKRTEQNAAEFAAACGKSNLNSSKTWWGPNATTSNGTSIQFQVFPPSCPVNAIETSLFPHVLQEFTLVNKPILHTTGIWSTRGDEEKPAHHHHHHHHHMRQGGGGGDEPNPPHRHEAHHHHHHHHEAAPLAIKGSLLRSFSTVAGAHQRSESRSGSDEQISPGGYEDAGSPRDAWEKANHNFVPPVLGLTAEHSPALNDDERRDIHRHLPFNVQQFSWTCLYSTKVHGTSIKTLLANVTEHAPLLLVAHNAEHKYGAFLVETLKASSRYNGSGESFVFTSNMDVGGTTTDASEDSQQEDDSTAVSTSPATASPALSPAQFQFFQWSKRNEYFSLCKPGGGIAIGGGPTGSAILLHDDLFSGNSYPCQTFSSPALSPTDEGTGFDVYRVDVYGFQHD